MEDKELIARLESIENRIRELEQSLKPQIKISQTSASPPPPQRTVSPVHLEEEAQPPQSSVFFEWLKTDWLLKLGALLLILAFTWFVRYAFINNWIGPMGRIALGIVAGTLIMLFGHLQIPKRNAAGQVLAVTGGVMILLTIFAARTLYNFFTPMSALGIMFLVVVALAIIAIVRQARSLAILALLGGAFVPYLTDADTPNYIVLLSYIFVLDLGALVVVAMRGWRDLIFLALLITGMYGVAFYKLDQSTVWIFMALFYGLFFSSNLAALLRTRKATSSDLLTAGISGLLLLYWIYEFVPREWASLLLSGLVLLMVVVSYLFMRFQELTSPLYINAGLGVLFLGAATAFELEGATLTIAYAIEAFAVTLLAAWLLKKPAATQAISVVQAVPLVLAVRSLDLYDWRTVSLFNQHFFVLLIVILSFAGTAWVLHYWRDEKAAFSLFPVHAILGGFFGLALIWLSAHNLLDFRESARAVSLVIYSIIGVTLFFYGTHLHKKLLRISGAVLLAGVVLRLLFIEVWDMPLSGRIITFVTIGVLLISTAFFQKRLQ